MLRSHSCSPGLVAAATSDFLSAAPCSKQPLPIVCSGSFPAVGNVLLYPVRVHALLAVAHLQGQCMLLFVFPHQSTGVV